jgi:hypothetical protein
VVGPWAWAALAIHRGAAVVKLSTQNLRDCLCWLGAVVGRRQRRRGERALSARVWQPMQRRPGVARGGGWGRAASPSLPPGGAGLAGEAVMLSLFQELGDSLAGQVGVQGRIHWAASLAGDIRIPYRQGSRQAA